MFAIHGTKENSQKLHKLITEKLELKCMKIIGKALKTLFKILCAYPNFYLLLKSSQAKIAGEKEAVTHLTMTVTPCDMCHLRCSQHLLLFLTRCRWGQAKWTDPGQMNGGYFRRKFSFCRIREGIWESVKDRRPGHLLLETFACIH